MNKKILAFTLLFFFMAGCAGLMQKRSKPYIVTKTQKDSFTVIGKEGTAEKNSGDPIYMISALWEEMNSNFEEVKKYAKKDSFGNTIGFWGAMSDQSGTFLPWGDNEGVYLAGLEAEDDAEIPDGWVKWVVPAFEYLVVECTLETYRKALNYVLYDYMPENSYKLIGAVQEFYSAHKEQGTLFLYFPIGKPESE